jgi:putative ABC transport system permease protein
MDNKLLTFTKTGVCSVKFNWFRRQQREEELDTEIRSHLDAAIRDRIARGEAPDEARANALREFGNVGLVKEVTREMWGWSWLEALMQDLRFGVRMLRKNPGFSSIAILTLALAIGANTAIFSVVNAVLLRPLPFKEPDRLVMVWERRPTSGDVNLPVAAYEFAAWRERARSFERLALVQASGLNLTGAGEAEIIKAWRVSAEFFSLLGVPMLQGRDFAPGEDQAGRNNIVVLNQTLWQRRFAADPDVVGKTIFLNDQSFTVVGIAPALNLMPDVWVPLDWPGLNASGHDGFNVMGRLKVGIPLEQAQTELAQLARQLEQSDPSNNTGHGVQIVSLHENTVGKVSRALWVLFGAVAFVLLIACANVANLLLTRAVARQKEIAIRAALGATRLRVMRQLLTESLLLAGLSGGLGLLLAHWLTTLLPKIEAVKLPRLEQISLDGKVLAATIGLSLLTGLLTGIAPAWHSFTSNLSQRLLESTRGLKRRRNGSVLVVLELALTLILLVGSGLMLKSFVRLTQVDPGFDPANVLRLDLSLPALRYAKAEQQAQFYEQLIERLKVLPGVEAVGATSQSPLLGSGNWGAVAIEGRPAPSPGQETYVAVTSISADYFRTMRIPLTRGRAFTEFDGAQAAGVVIINETMARQFWPRQNPLGQRLRTDNGSLLTLMGVVGDVRQGGLNARPNPEMFIPHRQAPDASLAVMVRTANDASSLTAGVREQVTALDPNLPAPLTTMEQHLSASVAGQRFNALLLGSFGALALGLAFVGVFGVIHYSVAQRTHEIGVRLALGAQRRGIFKLVIGQGLRLALLGTSIGLLGAWVVTRVIAELLYDVNPLDATTFIFAPLLLTSLALLACWIPARRATKVDPLIALRHE